MEPELLAQFPLLEDALVALGVAVWPMVEYEADDALASAAAVAREPTRGSSGSFICTPDKDLAQCVGGPGGRAARPRARTRIDRRGRRAREVRRRARRRSPTTSRSSATPPTASPGLPGWGAKSAAAVLARYEHIDAIPDDVAAWDVQRARRGQARGDARRRARRRQPVPRPRDAAHRRRRRRRRRLGVARARRRSSSSGPSGSAHPGREPRATAWPRSGGSDDGAHRAAGGGVHVLRARRRPADGELVLLLHGFPETSYEWRAQLPVLAAAGYRVVRARPARLRRGRPAGERRRLQDRGARRRTRSGSPTRSGVDRSTSSATTGAVPWRGSFAVLHRRPPAHADRRSRRRIPRRSARRSARASRRRSRPTWSRSVIRGRGGDVPRRRRRHDAAGAGRASACTTPTRSTSTTGCSAEPGAMTGGLNWYRANDIRAGGLELPAVTVPTMYVWSTDDKALGQGGGRGDGRVGHRAVPLRGARGREPLAARRGSRRAQRTPARPLRQRLILGTLRAISAGQGQSP